MRPGTHRARPAGGALLRVEQVRRVRRRVVGVTVVLFLIDCGGGSPKEPTVPVAPTPVLTTVTVSLSAATIQVGQTDTARATGLDQRGAPMSVGTPVWTTASSAIATVSASGIVTGVAPGQTTLIASVGGKQGQATSPSP